MSNFNKGFFGSYFQIYKSEINNINQDPTQIITEINKNQHYKHYKNNRLGEKPNTYYNNQNNGTYTGITYNATNNTSSQTFTPKTICSYYNYPIPTSSNAPTVAILSFGGTYYINTLTSYIKANSTVPSATLGSSWKPNITLVQINGAPLVPDVGGADIENMLDLSMILGCNPYTKIRFYMVTNTNTGFVNFLKQFVIDVKFADPIIPPTF